MRLLIMRLLFLYSPCLMYCYCFYIVLALEFVFSTGAAAAGSVLVGVVSQPYIEPMADIIRTLNGREWTP